MLNVIWIGFFLVAFAIGLGKLVLFGQTEVFPLMMKATFDSARTGFEIALGLTGVMTLWLGVMKIGEKAGFLALLTRLLAPLFRRLMPDVPPDHPALGAITMNMAANMLGLDNAATPDGTQGDARAADPQPHARHRQQRANPVPGDQRFLRHPAAGDHLHLPRPARRGRPDRRVHPHPAGDLLLHPGGAAGGGRDTRRSICSTVWCSPIWVGLRR